MNTTRFHVADFLTYIRQPQYIAVEQPDAPWPDRLRLIGQLWWAKAKIGFSLAILAAIVQMIVARYTHLSFDHSLHLNGWGLVLAVVVLAPLLEESLFRGMLKPTVGRLVLVAFLITFYVAGHTMDGWAMYHTAYLPLALGSLVGVPGLIYALFRSPRRLARLQQFWQRHFGLIFYLVAISFGLVHLSNFHHLTVWHYLLAPVLTLPQLFSGFYLGYVRMRYGIWYSIALHALWNAVPASLTVAYLLMH